MSANKRIRRLLGNPLVREAFSKALLFLARIVARALAGR